MVVVVVVSGGVVVEEEVDGIVFVGVTADIYELLVAVGRLR